MIIGGLQKLTMIDYPGKLSAIIWTKGCNFLCPFCHNAQLLDNTDGEQTLYTPEEILQFLSSRQGMLDAVSISGGEPLLHDGLVPFMQEVKKMNFLLKLDTNGYSPEKLERALPYVDYVAMDLKAPLAKYHLLAGTKVDLRKIKKSVAIIKKFPRSKEFRTTLVHPFLEVDDIAKIYDEHKLDGIDYFVQNYHPIAEDSAGEMWSFSPAELEQLGQEVECQVRSSS